MTQLREKKKRLFGRAISPLGWAEKAIYAWILLHSEFTAWVMFMFCSYDRNPTVSLLLGSGESNPGNISSFKPYTSWFDHGRKIKISTPKLFTLQLGHSDYSSQICLVHLANLRYTMFFIRCKNISVDSITRQLPLRIKTRGGMRARSSCSRLLRHLLFFFCFFF